MPSSPTTVWRLAQSPPEERVQEVKGRVGFGMEKRKRRRRMGRGEGRGNLTKCKQSHGRASWEKIILGGMRCIYGDHLALSDWQAAGISQWFLHRWTSTTSGSSSQRYAYNSRSPTPNRVVCHWPRFSSEVCANAIEWRHSVLMTSWLIAWEEDRARNHRRS